MKHWQGTNTAGTKWMECLRADIHNFQNVPVDLMWYRWMENYFGCVAWVTELRTMKITSSRKLMVEFFVVDKCLLGEGCESTNCLKKGFVRLRIEYLLNERKQISFIASSPSKNNWNERFPYGCISSSRILNYVYTEEHKQKHSTLQELKIPSKLC